MKLITIYLPKIETQRFNQYLQNEKLSIGKGENLSALPDDFLYVYDYIDWFQELEGTEIAQILTLVGDFSAFSIHWKSNQYLQNVFQQWAKYFVFVVDNDHLQIALSKDISNFSFEYFDNWIMGDTN